MANPTQIVQKVARNAAQIGLTVVSQGFNSAGIAYCVISNGSNNLTVTYLLAQIESPMGGVNPNISPFLGIGIANPGQIVMQSAISTAGSMADIVDSAVAAQVLQLISGFANDLLLCNSSVSLSSGAPVGGFSARLAGGSDWLGLGQ